MTILSKSKYISGLQCTKLLWTHYNAKHRIPPPDAATRWIFDQGHAVGALAQNRVPGGAEVPFGRMAATVEATRQLLTLRKPIYEASFSAAGVYCRVDVLRPVDGGTWDLLEVKSSTRVKDVNLHDISVQSHCLEAAGLELNRVFLVHLDREYVRRGPIDASYLFFEADVTDAVARLRPDVAPNVERFVRAIEGPEPDVPIGPHCDDPYECPLKSRCWAHVAPDPLPTGEATVDEPKIRRWLDGLNYPLLLLDFEAFSPAVPMFDGTRPYQAIPFQVSVHVLEAPDAEPTHLEFLHEAPDDPRPALTEWLAELPGTGDVVAWHASYERKILTELLDETPSTARLQSLIDRLVDLRDPFRWKWYEHPLQRGSTSLKAVLPAAVGASYAGDAIGDGQTAAREYQRVMHGQADLFERAEVLERLRSYCAKDTWAMVALLRVLETQTRPGPRGR